jgi:hypothetical protein
MTNSSREERPTHLQSPKQATISNNSNTGCHIDAASSLQTTISQLPSETGRQQHKFQLGRQQHKFQSLNNTSTIKLAQRL